MSGAPSGTFGACRIATPRAFLVFFSSVLTLKCFTKYISNFQSVFHKHFHLLLWMCHLGLYVMHIALTPSGTRWLSCPIYHKSNHALCCVLTDKIKFLAIPLSWTLAFCFYPSSSCGEHLIIICGHHHHFHGCHYCSTLDVYLANSSTTLE